jgi:hypothetical protein
LLDGTSTGQTDYKYLDYITSAEILYYKLSQVDFDGEVTELGVESVNASAGKTVIKVVKLMGQEVSDDYLGIRVIIYYDGTYLKTLKKQELFFLGGLILTKNPHNRILKFNLVDLLINKLAIQLN